MGKLFRFLCVALLAAAFSLPFAACRQSSGSSESVNEDYFSYTDDYNNTVLVPANPHRVVSLSPAVTEIMFAMGADSLLVGRTEFCKYPPEAAAIENIGGISNLNIEKVLSLNPDIIICGSMIPRRVVEKIESMGVPMVCVIEKQHFDALYENITKIGLLINRKGSADSLVEKLRSEVEGLNLEPVAQPKSVYYVVGFGSGGNFTAGGDTFINEIIQMAGGRNIAQDSKGWTFSVEALLAADPDFVLIRREDSASFCSSSPYNRLSAIAQGRIVCLDDGILDLQVPRNIEAIRMLHDALTR